MPIDKSKRRTCRYCPTGIMEQHDDGKWRCTYCQIVIDEYFPNPPTKLK